MSKLNFAFGTAAAIGVNIASPLIQVDLSNSSSHFGSGVASVIDGINLISADGSEIYSQAYGQSDGLDNVTPSATTFGWLPTVSRLTVFNSTTGKWDRVRSDGNQGSLLVGQSVAANMQVAASLQEMAVSIRSMLKGAQRPMWWDRVLNGLRVTAIGGTIDTVTTVSTVASVTSVAADNLTGINSMDPVSTMLRWQAKASWSQGVRGRIS